MAYLTHTHTHIHTEEGFTGTMITNRFNVACISDQYQDRTSRATHQVQTCAQGEDTRLGQQSELMALQDGGQKLHQFSCPYLHRPPPYSFHPLACHIMVRPCQSGHGSWGRRDRELAVIRQPCSHMHTVTHRGTP